MVGDFDMFGRSQSLCGEVNKSLQLWQCDINSSFIPILPILLSKHFTPLCVYVTYPEFLILPHRIFDFDKNGMLFVLKLFLSSIVFHVLPKFYFQIEIIVWHSTVIGTFFDFVQESITPSLYQPTRTTSIQGW